MSPQVLLQGFYKRGKYIAAPCPADKEDGPGYDWWWDFVAKNAADFARTGFTAVWLPPVTKAQQGVSAAALGYSVFDDYDIGSKSQKGTTPTRYGTREQLTRCAAMLRANGIGVYLDLQLNHRKEGEGPDGLTFEYPDAYGHKPGGRFPKNAHCFHSRYPAGKVPPDFKPEIPQDPNVPDGIGELQEGSKVYFGPDLAHINAKPAGYVAEQLIAAVEWVSDALDVQGYRLDHVQGISADFLKMLLNRDRLKGRFAVGEYWDGVVDHVGEWVWTPRYMNLRCSAFDFPLYFKLLAMANDPHFNMAELDHAGLAGRDPFRAVTFVENHDTESRRDLVAKNIQPEDKPLAYAYILTSEGLPCVFIKDYITSPGCLGDQLKPILVNLVWIRQNIADGLTQQRWKSQDVFVYERLGGSHLLVGLNKNKHASQTLAQVETGFPPHTVLHDYTGHAPDITTDAGGRVTLVLPKNTAGKGYVCYSVAGLATQFGLTPSSVTQVFAGAQDLDIKPADNTTDVQVSRIWVEAGTPIRATLDFDATGWTGETAIRLTLLGTTGVPLATREFHSGDQGAAMAANATQQGWYTFRIRSFKTPEVNLKPAYQLRVSYQAPKTATF